MRRRPIGSALAVLALLAAACSTDDTEVSSTASTALTASPERSALVLDVLAAEGNFATFIDLVEKSGLQGTLLDDGPFTVFAPTDAAFAALSDQVMSAWMADQEALRQALLYHLISGEIPTSAITGRGFATTMAGYNVDLAPGDEGVKANNVSISQLAAAADNGLIYAADGVLLIPTVLDILRQSGTFQTILGAFSEEQLAILAGPGPITFFATTDVAFSGSAADRFRQLTNDAPAFDEWFRYHLIEGETRLADLQAVPEAMTSLGVTLVIGQNRDFTTVAGADVVITDVPAANGVIQIVDDLFSPPSPEPETGNGDDDT